MYPQVNPRSRAPKGSGVFCGDTDGHPRLPPRQPLPHPGAGDGNGEGGATVQRKEIQFLDGGKNYAYGFVFNHERIVEEWLYEITRRSEKMIFERNAEGFNIDTILRRNKSADHRQFLTFLAKSTPDNQLFLHEAISRKVRENVEDIADLTATYNWFLNTLKIVFPEDKYREGIKSEIISDDQLHRLFEELLKYFGTGINGITLEDVDLQSTRIPDKILSSIREELFNTKAEDSRIILNTLDYTFFLMRDGAELKAQKFMTRHAVRGGGEELFDTKDESDGTNRIIDLIPLILDLLKGNNVFIIDEMERSLHPNLIYDIFDLFLEFSANVDSQLIVATHESSLLTQKLFRKDEIWFVVKDDSGASTLYSLEDYNVRFDKEIRKDYLLGRYKAIPRLGNRYELSIKPSPNA